jgi:hypothetical protein
MRPEMPFFATGAVVTVGAVRRGVSPSETTGPLIAVVALVIAASATAGTRIAPLVRAFGLLCLMAAVYKVAPMFQLKGR